MKSNFILLIGLFFTGFIFSQNAVIEGVVLDKELNLEPVPFAEVYLKGTNFGTSTDFDGLFELTNIPPANYTLVVNFVGYETVEVEVKAVASETLELSLQIAADSEMLDEIIIRAERRQNTEAVVLESVKKAKVVVNAISAEQMQKSTDGNAAEVMQRVPGVTIIDGKFVMVRGLSERYNNVFINGAMAPSTEVDKRTFSFDLIPTNALDKMQITKTGASYLPGDFSGGFIEVTTSENFEEFTRAGFEVGYRTGTTFNDYFQSEGSSTDFLGFDDGFRQLPSGFPSQPSDFFDNQVSVNAANSLPNNFNPTRSTTFLDAGFGFGIGRKFRFKNDATLKTVNTLSYSNSYVNYNQSVNKYDAISEGQDRPGLWSTFNDQYFSNKVRLTLMSNWIYAWNSKNSITFKNLFNQTGINETILREGFDFQQRQGDVLNNYLLGYESRGIYSGQIKGNHFIADNQKLDWVVGGNYVAQSMPDLRRFRTFRRINEPDAPFTMIDPPSSNLFDTGRFYSELSEFAVSNGLDYMYELKNKMDEYDEADPIKLKSGYYLDYRKREFDARYVSFLIPGYIAQDRKQELTRLPLNEIFSPENVNAQDGWIMREGTTPRDQYDASNFLTAGYLYGEFPVGKFNLSGGLRVERNILQIEGNDGSQEVNPKQDITSILPSFNFSLNSSEKSVFRLAYSRSVNRPEFREIAPFLFYDFEFDAERVGNPDLTTATIDNLDFRYEFYPRENETMSIGAFYKYFDNPIETISPVVSEQRRFTYFNSDYARNYGLEVEIRKSLHDISNHPIISKLAVNFNASYIISEVNLGDSAVGEQGQFIQEQSRPLEGQSPYIINLALNYENKEKDLSVNIVYNRFGDRIFSVGNNIWRTIYELSRDQVDLNVSKKIGNITYRLSAVDLLNAKFQFFEDTNFDGKIRKSDDNLVLGFRRGTLFSFSLTYDF